MKKYFYSLILLSALAISGAAQTLNVLTYGADPTGATDSWQAFQKAVDDAGNIGRGFGGSGSAGSNLVTINPATGANPSWQQFSAADAGQYITIEANTGLASNQYYLLIDRVISPTQCAVKSWNSAPVSFVNGFSDVMVLWQRAGLKGRKVSIPGGWYKLGKPLQVLTGRVGLIGEGAANYVSEGSKLTFTNYGAGIMEIPFVGKDTYWLPRGPALIAGAGGSYWLKPGMSPAFVDFQDVPYLNLQLKDAGAFTVELFCQPNQIIQGDILSFSGALPGGGQERAFSIEIDPNLKFTARVNIGGTTYIRQWQTIPTAGTLYHIALQFDGNELGLFVNGASSGTLAGLSGKKLQTRPYELFNWGSWRSGFPGGGQQGTPLNCYVSHLRVSKIARYSMAGFTPSFTVPAIDANTLLMDEGESWQEKLFTVSFGGRNQAGTYDRTEAPKYGQGGWAFQSGHVFQDFAVYAYGAALWQRQTIGGTFERLGLHTYSVGLYCAGDTFSNSYKSINIAGTRGGIVNSGPAGIVTYQDISITGGQIGAWLSSGSGVLSNLYIHGPSRWQLIFDNWEGSIQGTYFSNEDVVNTDFQGNVWIGNGSDVTISGSKFETYAQPVPSVTIAGVRSATFINGMFEPHASATECIKFTGTAPKSKVVLVNPNHGRKEGVAPQTNVPWSVSAPAGKLTVIQ